MDQANFLGQDELSKIYGAGNVEGVMQGRQQVDLANMFNQQKQQMNQEELLGKQNQNLFDTQNNPLRLEHQSQQNRGLGITNDTNQIGLDRARALAPMELNVAQKELAVKASDAELKQAENHAYQLLGSLDPQEQKMGQTMIQFTKAAQDAKRKFGYEEQLKKMEVDSHLKGIDKQQAGEDRRNKANIDARIAAAGAKAQTGVKNIQAAVQSGKMSPANAAVALHGAAMFETDEKLQETYFLMASQYETLAKQLKPNPLEGKPDTSSVTGIPAVPSAPPSLVNPRAAPAQPKAPQAAIAHLKAHPELSEAFKAKYGYLP